MQELISRVVQSVGIDESMAKPAIGVVLNMLKSVLPEGTATQILSSLGGADSLMSEATQAGKGGLGGMIGGALSSVTGGSAGAVTEAMSKMQSLGLNSDQAKGVAQQVIGFAKEQAPSDATAELDKKFSGLLG